MGLTVTVEVSISVNNEEQANKIYEAAASGLLETAIKDRVLFNGGNVVASPTGSSNDTYISEKKKRESEIKLTRVGDKAPVVKVSEDKPTEARSRNVLGRKRFGRSGG